MGSGNAEELGRMVERRGAFLVRTIPVSEPKANVQVQSTARIHSAADETSKARELMTMMPGDPIRWRKYAGNPVYGEGLGTCFDVCVLPVDGELRLYFSWRPRRTVALAVSADGIHFGPPRILLAPPDHPEEHYNRLCVLPEGEGYRMYVTRQYNPDKGEPWSRILTTSSPDGIHWDQPLTEALTPDCPWEKQAVMCPSVLIDPVDGRYKLWYSGGEQYEPDAIGYAESDDGLHWRKHPDNPIFRPDPTSGWEKEKVTACQVIREPDGFRMFYIGFETVDTARIGMAVSPDGITGWRRYPGNPILGPDREDWDKDACYKPYALRGDGGWRLWYNGRTGPDEQICLALYPREDF